MARRRLPFDSIRVDDEDIPVVEKHLGRLTEGYGVSGQTDADGPIEVEPRALYATMLIAVFDEAFHKMWRKSQLAGRYADTTEEFIVHELSPFLREFLLDNPEWLDEYRRVNGR